MMRHMKPTFRVQWKRMIRMRCMKSTELLLLFSWLGLSPQWSLLPSPEPARILEDPIMPLETAPPRPPAWTWSSGTREMHPAHPTRQHRNSTAKIATLRTRVNARSLRSKEQVKQFVSAARVASKCSGIAAAVEGNGGRPNQR